MLRIAIITWLIDNALNVVSDRIYQNFASSNDIITTEKLQKILHDIFKKTEIPPFLFSNVLNLTDSFADHVAIFGENTPSTQLLAQQIITHAKHIQNAFIYHTLDRKKGLTEVSPF